ncbi:MAG: nicotinate-nucleotide diphosphorylase (carboxylating), partial [Deltaproteobacteria bacterium]|nr:nicotinate-nucleotide diphosphorylase (carboxylating) [Nannocystaceae bacterium]
MWDPELGDLDTVIDRALGEDLSAGDVTARATVSPGASTRAVFVAKSELVVCGLPIAARVFAR